MHNLNEEVHAITYSSLEKEYRRVIQKARREYNDSIRTKLENYT